MLIGIYLCWPRNIRITDLNMDLMNIKDMIYISMLFAVHHQPYNITIIYIEPSEDGEGFFWREGDYLSFIVLFFFFFY